MCVCVCGGGGGGGDLPHPGSTIVIISKVCIAYYEKYIANLITGTLQKLSTNFKLTIPAKSLSDVGAQYPPHQDEES